MTDPTRALVVTAVLLLLPYGLQAQQDGWAVEGELGASVFFGNTSATTITTRIGAETADSVRELSVDGLFTYGEATDDEGESFVNKRTWKLGTDVTYRPLAQLSSFLTLEFEKSFERRIELRYTFGIGGKLSLQRSDRGRVDLGVSVLGEATNPTDDRQVSGDFDDDLRAKWSVRARARREWAGGRVSFETENLYRPQFSKADDFTATSTSSIGFEVSETVTLKLVFVDNFDSEAELRGADTNNDGQFLVSVLSSF